MRSPSVSVVVLVLLAWAGTPTRAYHEPPRAESPDHTFDTLLDAAKKAPETADWKALRRAFAETSYYNPYDVETRKKLQAVGESIARGDLKSSEPALQELLAREHFMRIDTLAMLVRLHEEKVEPEKVALYRQILRGILGTLLDPKAGDSYETAIEVLFIDEEYFVTRKLPVQGRSLQHRGEHRFDVFTIKAQSGRPERRMYFNVDLPQNALGRLLQPKAP